MHEVREHDLEDNTTTLRELDKYRKESTKLRDEGLEALDAWVKEHVPCIDPRSEPRLRHAYKSLQRKA